MRAVSIHHQNRAFHQNTGVQQSKESGNDISRGHLLDTLHLTSESLTKRAERKALTERQVEKLLQLDSPLLEQYERSSSCAMHFFHKEHTVTKEQKLFTAFCGKRWCSVCSAIKTAEMMNGYLKPIKSLPDLHFVTLTIPAVKRGELKQAFRSMQTTFTQIKDLFRKKGMKLSGIRKTECNYNPVADTYNPHYHLIVSGRKIALSLVDEWLSRNPECSVHAQDVKKADKRSLNELFKYQVKSLIGKKFYPEQQDQIYRAMNGIRAFQPFGNVKKCSVTNDNSLDDTEPDIADDETSQTGEWVTLGVYSWNTYHLNWLNAEYQAVRPVYIRKKVQRMLSQFRE